MTFKHSLLLAAVSGFVVLVPQVSAAGQASIKIEQLSASQVGTWTMLSQDGSVVNSTDKGVDQRNYSFGLTTFGQTTLSVTPPPGMSVRISVYNNGDFLTTVEGRQYSVPILANDDYRFVVQYALTALGSLGVTSDPNHLRFRMKMVKGRTYNSVTPHTFNNLPAGKYSLYFGATDECVSPAVQTVEVEPGKRTVATVTLTCNVHDDDTIDRSRISKRALREYVEQRETKTRGERK